MSANDTLALKPGTAQYIEITAHTNDVVSAAVQIQVLDQQITALQLKVEAKTATDQEIIKLGALKAQLAVLKANPPDPTKTNTTSPSASDVGTAVALSDFTITALAATPTPIANNSGTVVHVTLDPNDLLNYINLTQFMNPWGRNRQCDDDLKNLMQFINQDINAELGQWVEIGNRLSESSTD